MAKISMHYKFPIDGLKWIPYVIGWIFGVFNLMFWLILLIVGVLSKDKHRFIDKTFHEVVYVYGVVCIGIILMILIIASFMLKMSIS